MAPSQVGGSHPGWRAFLMLHPNIDHLSLCEANFTSGWPAQSDKAIIKLEAINSDRREPMGRSPL